MCTSFTYYNNDFYFGRNLDLDCCFGEEVVITPRNYEFNFRDKYRVSNHSALIGMATVVNGYPLYAEAINEYGVGMAGLEFKGNAVYFERKENKDNITPFELIPWVLVNAKNIKEAKDLFEKMNILNEPFSENMPLSPLHWIIADKDGSFVVETVKGGLKIHDNPFGVLTNNPPFEYHKWNMTNCLNLTNEYPENRLSDNVDIVPFANGMGAIGLPGDASSPSRFIKTFYLKENLRSNGSEEENVMQYFRVLNQVSMVKGSVITKEKKDDYTTYSCCMNASKGIYYYQTYENSNISSVNMYNEDLEKDKVIQYPLDKKMKFIQINPTV